MCISAEIEQTKPQLELKNDLETKRITPGQWGDQQMGRVKDLVTWNISVISPKTTLQEADYLLRQLQAEVLAVYEGRLYQGFVTRSSVEQMKKSSGTLHQSLAPEGMEQSIEPGALDESLFEVYRRMRQTGHASLPVLDADGRLAGLLTAATIEAHFPNVAVFSNHPCGNN